MRFDLFDGHCDTISRCWRWPEGSPYYNGGSLRKNSGHLDLVRTSGGPGRYCQFFAIFGDRDAAGHTYREMFDEQYRLFCREMEQNADLIVHCRTAAEAERANAVGKTAAFLTVEGAELLDCSPDRLEEVYRKGVRAVNLTWNYENELSGSNAEGADKGLTEQGRAFVRKMQELGMLVDVSHLSDPGFWDVAELAAQAGKPFIAGHSNSREICPHKRNLTDEQFTAIIRANGVAGLNMCDKFVGDPPTLDGLVAHVEHWMELGGQRSAAVGGDWDGTDLCPGIEDITGLEALYERLLRLNYPEDLVRDIFYNNLMRVVSEVCTT